MPPMPCGAATNSCDMKGMQPSAVSPTSAPSGSTGTARHPRTCSPSSLAMASTCSRASARGKFKVDDLSEEFDWQLDEDAGTVAAVGLGTSGATVFEVFQSDEPVCDDGVRAAALDVGDHGNAAGVRLVPRVVQALAVGQCRKQHWTVPPQSGKSWPGTAPARLTIVSAQLRNYPPRSVGTSGNPGRFRTTVQVMAATAMTTMAGLGINGCPRRQRTRSQAASRGRPTRTKTLSTTAAAKSPCSTSWVIRRPPQPGQFQPVSALNGHTGNKKPGRWGSASPT